MKRFALLLIIAMFYQSCDQEELVLEGELEYGTSFGECVGYCITEVYLSDDELTIVQKTWVDNQEIVHDRKLSSEEQRTIIQGIDEQKFLTLDEVIGCPDCADGGSEWLELTVDGQRKRVTFEYMSDIDGIIPTIKILRELVSVELEEDQ